MTPADDETDYRMDLEEHFAHKLAIQARIQYIHVKLDSPNHCVSRGSPETNALVPMLALSDSPSRNPSRIDTLHRDQFQMKPHRSPALDEHQYTRPQNAQHADKHGNQERRIDSHQDRYSQSLCPLCSHSRTLRLAIPAYTINPQPSPILAIPLSSTETTHKAPRSAICLQAPHPSKNYGSTASSRLAISAPAVGAQGHILWSSSSLPRAHRLTSQAGTIDHH